MLCHLSALTLIHLMCVSKWLTHILFTKPTFDSRLCVIYEACVEVEVRGEHQLYSL